MTTLSVAYLIISGAGNAGEVAPPLITGLAERFSTVLTVPTPNAGRVLNPRDVARLPRHEVVESYFAPSILPRPPRGLVLVAPCTFNSLNHLAAGLSPNLALAIASEAIGRRTPVIVAVACNADLWAHPVAPASAARLRAWGCTVLDPVPTDGPSGLTMAPVQAILAAVDAARAGYRAG
jgi:phosphopantothenoylcysteine synthetase/decarboxylase